MKELTPYIKCNSKIWEYVKPYLLKWGYVYVKSGPDWNNEPYLIIDYGGELGNMTSMNYDHDERRELVDVETFLERAAKLKGFTYKRKDIMKINGIEIKPGMVITTEDNINYIAFPTREGIAFTDNTHGGWQSSIPRDIARISDLTIGNHINNGVTLWEKPEEIVLTMDEIAKKFGYPVEQIKIKK